MNLFRLLSTIESMIFSRNVDRDNGMRIMNGNIPYQCYFGRMLGILGFVG